MKPIALVTTVSTLALVGIGLGVRAAPDHSPASGSARASERAKSSSTVAHASASDTQDPTRADSAIGLAAPARTGDPIHDNALRATGSGSTPTSYGVQLETRAKVMTSSPEATSELAAMSRDVFFDCVEDSPSGHRDTSFSWSVRYVEGKSQPAPERSSGPDAELRGCLREVLTDDFELPGFTGTLVFSFRPLYGDDELEQVLARFEGEAVTGIAPEHAPSRGPHSAELTVVECGDIDSLYAKKLAPVIDQVMDVYAGRVRHIALQNPMPFHAHGQLKAQALVAADQQGHYWDAADYLLSHGVSTPAELEAMAVELDMDASAFATALKAEPTVAEVERQQELCEAHGGHAAPTFFVNGRRLVGTHDFEVFERVFEVALGES